MWSIMDAHFSASGSEALYVMTMELMDLQEDPGFKLLIQENHCLETSSRDKIS